MESTTEWRLSEDLRKENQAGRSRPRSVLHLNAEMRSDSAKGGLRPTSRGNLFGDFLKKMARKAIERGLRIRESAALFSF